MTRRVFRLGEPSRDVDDELAFHIAERERALIAAGYDPATARAQAIHRFGDVSTVRSECLAIDQDRNRGLRWRAAMSSVRQDLVYSLRSLRRQPAFTAVVLLILALGIGANTAIFSLTDALLLRPLPVPHPDALVTIGDVRRTGSLSLGDPRPDLASYPEYADLRDETHTLSGLYASGRTERLDVVISRGDQPTHPHGRFVSGNFFGVLQVPAFAGQTFSAATDRAPGDDPVVVLSYGYWQSAFAGDRSILGRTIAVDNVPLTVIGVAARQFTGDIVGQATDLWIPIMMQPVLMPEAPRLQDRNISWLLLMGRLAPGVTLAGARSELTTLVERSLIDHANAADRALTEIRLRESPLQVEAGALGFSHLRSTYRAALVILMAAVGIVLLVVCANVANLLLARAVARSREISVRIALGASRRRLVQQLMTENLVLAGAGAALGLVVAIVGSRLLLQMVGDVALAVHFDGRVLGFALAVSIVTALLFGVAPSLRATGLSVAAALRTQGRSSGKSALALGRSLVIVQVALSMLLVVGAGMLARSALRLANADVGVARDRLVIVMIDAQRAGYAGERLRVLMRELTARVQAAPGVEAATLSENGIFSGTESGTTVQVNGFTARADSDSTVSEDVVGSNYFRAVGGHILRGRDFEARDNETAPKVIVVNESFARFFFPHGNATGQLVTVDDAPREIVGVVRDIEESEVRAPPKRRLYTSIFQEKDPASLFRLEVRTDGDPARLVDPLRQTLTSVNPALTILSVEPLTSLIRDSISGDRLVAKMVSVFGILALILAALGLYGVMAYNTVRRTAEFGLRMALGAAPESVGRMVLGDAVLMTGAGIAIGLPAALASARLVRAELFGIGLFDPPSIGLAMIVLLITAGVAALIPAARAMRVDPIRAIHTE